MKLLHFSLALLAVAVGTMALRAEDGLHDLQIGEAAPDFSLPGIDGKTHTLAEYKGAKLLMVAFLSNHCPSSHAAEGRMKQLIAETKGQGLVFVAINPNNPKGLSLDELGYSKYNDSFEDMKKYAKDQGFDFPYLYDGETQAVAHAYGCLATPHVFLFDAEQKLRYKGHFDDSEYADPATVHSPDARHAVEALLAGKEVPVAVTKPHGCSTKWNGKSSGIAQKMEKWDKTPVDVEKIDAAGVAALLKNGNNRVRLINVWATWCAPCVAEFPDLVTTARKFDMRNFDFISISADDPNALNDVKAFLEKRGAGLSDRARKAVKAEGRATNSYVFNGTSPEDLFKVLDPQWPGAIPHTVLVGANGEILWRHNGPIEGDELRAKVLEFMGPYYLPGTR
jgi:peroxiredoxin